MVSAAARFFGRAFALCLGFGSAPLPPAVGVLDLKWEWQIPTQNREFHFGPLHTHVYYIYMCVCACIRLFVQVDMYSFIYLPTYLISSLLTGQSIFPAIYYLPHLISIYYLKYNSLSLSIYVFRVHLLVCAVRARARDGRRVHQRP